MQRGGRVETAKGRPQTGKLRGQDPKNKVLETAKTTPDNSNGSKPVPIIPSNPPAPVTNQTVSNASNKSIVSPAKSSEIVIEENQDSKKAQSANEQISNLNHGTCILISKSNFFNPNMFFT